jgi:hypothetical protein
MPRSTSSAAENGENLNRVLGGGALGELGDLRPDGCAAEYLHRAVGGVDLHGQRLRVGVGRRRAA